MFIDTKGYFLECVSNLMFLNRAWVISAFSVVKLPVFTGDNPPYMPAVQDDKVVFRNQLGTTVEISDAKIGKAIFPMGSEVELNAGELSFNAAVEGSEDNPGTDVAPGAMVFNVVSDNQIYAGVTKKMVTTYHRALANILTLLYPFKGAFEYSNEEIKVGKLEKDIVAALKDKTITIEDLKLHYKLVHFLSSFSALVVPSISRKALTTDPNIAKRKKELFKENADKLDDPATIVKMEQELIAMDKARLEGDSSMGFYKSGKAFAVNRKEMYVTHGGEKDFEDPNKMTMIPNSLSEEIDIETLPLMINSLRDGSYSRGAETALGGEAAKNIARVFQNVKIAEDDCGDKVGFEFYINKDNYKLFVGRYRLEGQKLVLLTEDKLKGLIGKTIYMRSPLACKTAHTDFCKVCMGDTIADSGDAISMLSVNVGSVFLSSSLAKMHGKELSTELLDLDLYLT